MEERLSSEDLSGHRLGQSCGVKAAALRGRGEEPRKREKRGEG